MKKTKNCINNQININTRRNSSVTVKDLTDGITLIALVITIIILLILAGVAIAALGENGLISRAQEASFKTKMQGYKEQVIEYSMENILDVASDEINAGDVLKNAIKDGIVTDITEDDVTLNIQDIIKDIGKKEKEYVVIYKGEMCYVSSEKIKDNERQVKWCEEVGIKILEYSEAEGIDIINGKYELVNGIYVCTPKLDEGFVLENTRYMYLNDDGYLTPGNWATGKAPSNWYDYKNQKWANIYIETEGVEVYYVWVPRYVYKKDETNSITGNERMDVKFVDVDNNYIDAETNETTTYEELVAQGYQLPEAFEFGDDEDSMTSLAGYWISKYQLSELEKFNLDYNIAASNNSIVLSSYTNNVSDTTAKYTYALNGKIIYTSNELEDYTFRNLTLKARYVINVTALNANGEIVGSMTKKLEPVEVNPPELTGFDPDTTFYVYWDENGIEHNEIPISKGEPSNWYNYTYSNWANIVTRNDGLETYYVWIPRYQYSLNQTSEKSNVKFILGTGTDTDTGCQIPEAFWWDKDDDGVQDEGEQLTGYWITKYQLSREESEARITAELSAGTDCVHVKDITGTLLKTTDSDGNEVAVPLKYEYYLNGELKYEGTSATENYTYTGLSLNTTYTVNIIARNANTNAYVGAITKKVTTKDVNEPDLSSFISNEGLKVRTYYVVYDGDNISKYVPITEAKPNGWYDYSKSQWANIVVTDGQVSGNTITDATATSYFVWVPRYEYKILQSVNDWSNLSTANARTDVRFISGTDTTASVGYQIPEAFWWDKNDDGVQDEGEQLTGYWMSKYQLSN